MPQQPVIVFSPAMRAGTTLVQRLLCSAPNTLIYGDLMGQEMDFFAKVSVMKQQALLHYESLAAVQRGAARTDAGDFLTMLTTPPAVYARQWRDAALAWLRGCEEEAAAQGRGVWGWKVAGVDGVAIAPLAAWLPEARWIWIERDLRECCRSAKAARMLNGAADVEQFCQAARLSSQLWRSAPVRHRLELDYAAMLADRAGTVRALEDFTGARGIDPSVFDLRINEPGARWTPPAELTAEEEAAFHQSSPATVAA